MTDEKQAAKLAKKRDKLNVKLAKKQEDKPAAGPSSDTAERSAAAAERQVRLQTLRVLLALAGLLVAGAMLLWTIKPWKSGTNVQPPTESQPVSAE